MFLRSFFLLSSALFLFNCGAYKQNLMFRTPEGFTGDPIQQSANKADDNYVIQKNDFLGLDVYSNNGEKLIDPNPELTQTPNTSNQQINKAQYLVDVNGMVKFPMIGELKVEGLTIRVAEQVIQKEYEKFYKSPFAILTFNNKRVIVLGAPGGQVIPLTNENTSLAEIIALSKGINNEGKAQNIRLLRGEKVYMVDFSTIEGYKRSNMVVEPGDIVYIEPVRKPLAEGFRDYGIILTFVVSITTLITLFAR